MKSVLLLIILSLFFVGCNSDEPKLSSIGSIGTGSSSAPYITNVTAPAFGIYTAGAVLDFYVTFNKPVTVIGTPRLTFVTDTISVNANYTAGTGTTTLHFSVTLSAGIDENGITLSQVINLNGGSIYDITTNEDAILTFTPPLTWGILINVSAPQLLSIIPPPDGTYTTGQKVTFRALFDSRVCVTGNPRLTIDVGGSPKFALWDSTLPVCATSHYFDYTVQLGDSDLDGIQLTGTSVNLAMVPSVIKNSFNTNATLTYSAATYPNLKVNGAAAAPTISSRAIPANGTFKFNDNLDFVITYSEVVTVSGSPVLNLDIGGNPRTAVLISGSGTTTLRFRYTVANNDFDDNGIQITGYSDLGATITNAGGTAAPLPGGWASTVGINVDGIAPTSTVRTSPVNGTTRLLNHNITYSMTFSEPVTVTGFPRFQITLATGTVYANYLGGTGTNTISFNYNVQEGDEDLDGIVTGNTLQLNGGTIKDLAGNDYVPAVQVWPAYSVMVDAKNPEITSVSFMTPGAFKQGDTAQLRITWSEPVTYTGTASVDFNAGGSTITFLQGINSGSQILFNYTVGANLQDYDGIAVASALLGTTGLADGVGRTPASLSIPAPSNKIYIVPNEVVNWYDTSDTITVGSSVTTLLQFKDLVSNGVRARSGTISYATSPYQPPLKYAGFSGTQSITYGFINLNYMVAVVDTSGAPSGPLLETDSGTPTVYAEFDGGYIKAPSCSVGGTCYYRLSNGTWMNVDTNPFLNPAYLRMMPYTTNTIKIIAVRWPSSSNNYRIGTGFNGRIHEVFFLNATVNTETEITDLINHLQTKYGVSY